MLFLQIVLERIRMLLYLLVLVGCDCGEFGLWEGEAVHSLGRQRLNL